MWITLFVICYNISISKCYQVLCNELLWDHFRFLYCGKGRHNLLCRIPRPLIIFLLYAIPKQYQIQWRLKILKKMSTHISGYTPWDVLTKMDRTWNQTSNYVWIDFFWNLYQLLFSSITWFTSGLAIVYPPSRVKPRVKR